MRIACNPLLEAPIITLIRLHQSLNTSGVCGIITEGSKHTVAETTIGSLGLLSFCHELDVISPPDSKLALVDISLSKGGISYSTIADASGDILSVPHHLDDTPFAMATKDISFKLLIGNTTSNDTLLEQDLFNYVSNKILTGQEFTPIPMPLLNKKLVKFDITREEGNSVISSDDVENDVLAEVINSIKII